MRLWLCVVMACLLSGCSLESLLPSGQTTIVLTFDDGPLPADVAPADRAAAGQALLDPLHQILAVLQQRGARAVFYVAATQDASLEPTWLDGIVAVHQAGQVLGYHAFTHDAAFWTDLLQPRDEALAQMEADYDRLEQFIDRLLEPAGLRRQDVFQPVFREPFGGGATGWMDGPAIGRARHWTCHGFAIDSVDWTGHADIAPLMRDRLLAATGGDPVARVLQQLTEGVPHQTDRQYFDVLMHVNSLTASHLNEWMDTLVAASEQAGRSVTFDVPAKYLENDDPAADFSAMEIMIFPGLE
jgi:peptidoglycan/xylan/chitin deacetylase (PgdA/CDA1 family)